MYVLHYLNYESAGRKYRPYFILKAGGQKIKIYWITEAKIIVKKGSFVARRGAQVCLSVWHYKTFFFENNQQEQMKIRFLVV